MRKEGCKKLLWPSKGGERGVGGDKVVQAPPLHSVFSLCVRSHISIRKAMCMKWDKLHVSYVSVSLQVGGGPSYAHLESFRTQQK